MGTAEQTDRSPDDPKHLRRPTPGPRCTWRKRILPLPFPPPVFNPSRKGQGPGLCHNFVYPRQVTRRTSPAAEVAAFNLGLLSPHVGSVSS